MPTDMPDFSPVLKQGIILVVFMVLINIATRVITYIVNQNGGTTIRYINNDKKTTVRYVLYRYINNDKRTKVSINKRYFDSKTLNLLINTFAPLDDIYDNFKSAKKEIKKEFEHLYIKYSVQLDMIKNSLIEIQEILKRSSDIEKEEIYKKIKKEIKNINPLIIRIVLDSNTIVLDYEKYLKDKNNAIHQLTKNELETKTLFDVSDCEMEIDELKKKYSKTKRKKNIYENRRNCIKTGIQTDVM